MTAFVVKSFRIYEDAASAEVIVDGVGKIDAKVNVPKELLEQIKQCVVNDIQQSLLARFEKKSEVIKVVDFNKEPKDGTMPAMGNTRQSTQDTKEAGEV